MSIQVTCPSCLARFSVSEKFAGQTGPCPKCKKPIKVPDAKEEVVIHAPDQYGPKDAEGRSVLKPLEREDTRLTSVLIAAMAAVCLATLAVAFIVGRTYGGTETGVPLWFSGLGAVLLAPPLAVAGYGVLRDQELEPYRGASLWIRASICGLVYAALWGAYAFLKGYLFEGDLELFHLLFVGPALIAAGGVASLAALELDYTSGLLHCGFYLLVTVLLRLVMGMPVY